MFGGPISFIARRLKVVATSTAEAEYAAAAATCKEIIFIRNIVADLDLPLFGPTLLNVDNQAAIKIAENIGVTKHSKHFRDSIHYFRELVEHRIVHPQFVGTKDQLADGFTKALDKTNFRIWCDKILDTRNRKPLAKSVAKRRYRYKKK